MRVCLFKGLVAGLNEGRVRRTNVDGRLRLRLAKKMPVSGRSYVRDGHGCR